MEFGGVGPRPGFEEGSPSHRGYVVGGGHRPCEVGGGATSINPLNAAALLLHLQQIWK